MSNAYLFSKNILTIHISYLCWFFLFFFFKIYLLLLLLLFSIIKVYLDCKSCCGRVRMDTFKVIIINKNK